MGTQRWSGSERMEFEDVGKFFDNPLLKFIVDQEWAVDAMVYLAGLIKRKHLMEYDGELQSH